MELDIKRVDLGGPAGSQSKNQIEQCIGVLCAADYRHHRE